MFLPNAFPTAITKPEAGGAIDTVAENIFLAILNDYTCTVYNEKYLNADWINAVKWELDKWARPGVMIESKYKFIQIMESAV